MSSSSKDAQLYRLDDCRHGRFLTNVNDTYIGHSLRTYGEWSEAEVCLFSQIVRPGDTVLEAGANIGSHTTWFSRAVGDTGSVLAFEANRHTHQLLCANLALNECLNVHAHHTAIGAAGGMIDFPVLDPKAVNNFGSASLVRHSYDKTERVMQRSVDELQLERLDFLKSDIEGYELELLKGAQATITRLRPVLFLEISPVPGRPTGNRDDLVGFLASLDYACYYYVAPMFNTANYRSQVEDVFHGVSIDMLCTPAERVSVQGLTQAEVGDTHIELREDSMTYTLLPWAGAQVRRL